jgi:hypothetical protein
VRQLYLFLFLYRERRGGKGRVSLIPHVATPRMSTFNEISYLLPLAYYLLPLAFP